MKRSSLFQENGQLTDEARNLMIDLKYGLAHLMDSDQVCDLTEMELRLLESHLHHLVGETISNRISKKEQRTNEYSHMSDEEFQALLQERYGSTWTLIPLTEEELKRAQRMKVFLINREDIQVALEHGLKDAISIREHDSGHIPGTGLRFKIG